MGVSEVRVRLAGMAKLISGVRTVKSRFPRTIQPSELPCVIIGVGEADYGRRKGESIREEVRRYTLTIYVAELTQKIEAKAEEEAEAFLERIADYFDARPGLELSTDRTPAAIAYDAELMGDSGIVAESYPPGSDKVYLAITYQIRVRQLYPIRYRD
jgi:hypothetical protein